MKHNQELIGQYVNRSYYTDHEPVGKIIGTRGKTILIIQQVVAGKNKTKMDFQVGGFSAHCSNNHSQEYDYTETDKVIELRMTKKWGKRGNYYIDEAPYKHYDYNF